MRLTWHIVRKDLLRLWMPLACWALLLIAKGEVGAWAARNDTPSYDQLFVFQLMEYTLLGLDLIVCALLAAALVQEDGLVGTENYWVTRPVGGGRLLAAKLASATLMFGLLPLVVAVRWWVVCGYDVGQMGRAALALLDGQFLLVLGAMVLAALTKSMSHFLAATIAVAVGVLVVGRASAEITMVLHPDFSEGAQQTGRVLGVALLVGGGAAVLAVQFLTRRRRRALWTAAVLMGVYLISEAGHWNFSGWWKQAPRTDARAAGVSIAVNEEPSGGPRLRYTLRGVPKDFGVRLAADHTLTWKDGQLVHGRSPFTTGSWAGLAEWRALGLGGRATEVAQQNYLNPPVGVEGTEKNDGDGIAVHSVFPMWGEQWQHLQGEPAAYRGDVHVTLWQPKVEWELPLRRGAQARSDGRAVRIANVTWAQGELSIALSVSTPDWTRYGKSRPALVSLIENEGHPGEALALVNRQRGEAIRLWGYEGKNSTLIVGTQEIWWPDLRGRAPREADEEKSEAQPRWLDGATLVVLRYEQAGRFDREVKMERFGGPSGPPAAP